MKLFSGDLMRHSRDCCPFVTAVSCPVSEPQQPHVDSSDQPGLVESGSDSRAAHQSIHNTTVVTPTDTNACTQLKGLQYGTDNSPLREVSRNTVAGGTLNGTLSRSGTSGWLALRFLVPSSLAPCDSVLSCGDAGGDGVISYLGMISRGLSSDLPYFILFAVCEKPRSLANPPHSII